jgi:hypothetical protein
MPKQIDYPRDSLSKSLQLADAVDELGGSCTADMCAASMNRAASSGAFLALISATGKYGLIDSAKGKLTTTERYKTYKHAYSDEEKQGLLRDAFLDIPVFSQLLERFHGKRVPEEILSKLLIREFDVSERDASRVASFFLDGLTVIGSANGSGPQEPASNDQKSASETLLSTHTAAPVLVPRSATGQLDGYVVNIAGPGFHHEIRIAEPEDLLIVEAILNKVRRKLDEQ